MFRMDMGSHTGNRMTASKVFIKDSRIHVRQGVCQGLVTAFMSSQGMISVYV